MTVGIVRQVYFVCGLFCVLSSVPAFADMDIPLGRLYPACMDQGASDAVQQAACEKAALDQSLPPKDRAVAYFTLETLYRIKLGPAAFRHNLAPAIAYMKEAVRLDPTDFLSHTELADLYSEAGDFNAVIAETDQMLAINEDSPSYYFGARSWKIGSLVKRAEIYCKLGEPAKAQRDVAMEYKLLAEMQHHYPPPRPYEDFADLQKKLAPPACLVSAPKAADQAPPKTVDPNPKCNDGSWVEAGCLTVLARRAADEENRDDFLNAAADYELLASLEKQSIRVPGYQADACRNRAAAGQLEQALRDCEPSIAAGSDVFSAHAARGLTFLKLGEFDKAITDFDAELDIMGQSTSTPLAAFPFYGRGVAKLKKGDSAGGNADIAKANAIQLDIAGLFTRYGVSIAPSTAGPPPVCSSSSTLANPAIPALSLIPGCLPVFCSSEVDATVRQNLKHIDDKLIELQTLLASADASWQKFSRACRAINGDLTVTGPRMVDFSNASYDLSVNKGRLSDMYDSLQTSTEEGLFSRTRDSMTRTFRQPLCMMQINTNRNNGLNAAETLINKLEINCAPGLLQQ